MDILARVKTRLPEENDDILLAELIQTIEDRICLRLGVDELPTLFGSICVEATIKAYRRQYYEGINSESADTLNTSFYEDILAEYDEEFSRYINQQYRENTTKKRRVRFI